MTERYGLWVLKHGPRQPAYGIGTADSDQPETIHEAHGTYTMSKQHSVPMTLLRDLPRNLTWEQRFDILAAAEQIGCTWAEQDARLRAIYPDDYEETMS